MYIYKIHPTYSPSFPLKRRFKWLRFANAFISKSTENSSLSELEGIL
jgi:hypothetical protein